MNEDQARDRLRRLLDGQPLGVLATCTVPGTHATLVAFAVTEDLRQVIFATGRDTRKFASLRQNPQVALLVDDRSNDVADFRDATAATAHGSAVEVESDRLDRLRTLYLCKHPYLEDFVRAPSCALVGITVETYDLVGNFQEVHVLRVGNGLDPPD